MKKYNYIKGEIKQDIRKTVNSQLLIEIGHPEPRFTPEQILNAYTGKGRLHELKFNSYDCFYDYTQAKQEIEAGAFYTPFHIAERITEIMNPKGRILDPCGGKGIFCNFSPEDEFTMVEIDYDSTQIAKHLFPKAEVIRADIQYWESNKKFDYILTNPPFNLRWIYDQESCSSQHFILASAVDWLREYGLFAAVVPDTYLMDEMYYKKDIEIINQHFNWLGQVKLPLDTFRREYGILFPTKVIFLQKHNFGYFSPEYSGWEDIRIRIQAAQELRKENLIEVVQSEKSLNDWSFKDQLSNEHPGFEFQCKKYLFEIKVQRPKKDRLKYYQKGLDLIRRFRDQAQPLGMSDKDWAKSRLTEKKVISILKQYALIRKKKRELRESPAPDQNQLIPFDEVVVPDHIKKEVDAFSFANIKGVWNLNDIQKLDVGRLLTKKYAALNGDTGTGKTAMTYAISKVRKAKLNIILSTALAISKTWIPHLEFNGESYKVIKSPDDIDFSVDYWLIGFTALAYSPSGVKSRLPKFIKRQLRRISNKAQLIIDESDELSSRASKRYKAARTALVYCKYKLIATATSTRNNAAELYSQYELLYNNSMNMIDTCKMIYYESKERGELATIKEKANDNFGQQFHAYLGLSQFKRCFAPAKKTVFGIKKHDQDVYNYDELLKLMKYTSIVRTFEEVTGKKPNILHKRFDFTPEESELYRIILDEFQRICYQHFRNSGNARKESGQRLLRQLQLLIKSVSMPESFEQYTGHGSTKKSAIIDIIEKRNEKTMIGCLRKDTAKSYFEAIQQKFLRPVYYIDGSCSYNKRGKILAEFQQTQNGIVICTQQSLKSSINIPDCNLVLIESMDWNMPKIHQFYSRTVRFDSEMSDIYFITLAGTIDDNLAGLLMAKERINKALKYDRKDDDELYDELGFDISLLDTLMNTEIDKESGRLNIRWGKQALKAG